MGIWSKIFGGETITKPIEAVGNVLDELFTSNDEKLTHEEVKMRLMLKSDLANSEINKIEAQNRNLFVAGWRPFVGWICAFALMYNFIFRDLIIWFTLIFNSQIVPPPNLAIDNLMTILMGLLGLGGLRTFEKIKGKAK